MQTTVAIPVYNGSTTLNECLESLAAQDCPDFKIVVCDNASTDTSVQIAQDYASKHTNVSVYQNETNVGHAANFLKTLEKCETEFFMWRADDDLSTPNYVSVLQAALNANPDKILAAPAVELWHSPTDHRPVPAPEGDLQTADIAEIAMQLPPNWYYGLWRTEAIRAITHSTWQDFPHAHGRDHLTVLRPALLRKIVYCPEARFFQRTYSPDKGDGMRGNITMDQRIERLEILMPAFRRAYMKELDRHNFPAAERAALAAICNAYTYKNIRATEGRIARLKVKRFFKKIFGQAT